MTRRSALDAVHQDNCGCPQFCVRMGQEVARGGGLPERDHEEHTDEELGAHKWIYAC